VELLQQHVEQLEGLLERREGEWPSDGASSSGREAVLEERLAVAEKALRAKGIELDSTRVALEEAREGAIEIRGLERARAMAAETKVEMLQRHIRDLEGGMQLLAEPCNEAKEAEENEIALVQKLAAAEEALRAKERELIVASEKVRLAAAVARAEAGLGQQVASAEADIETSRWAKVMEDNYQKALDAQRKAETECEWLKETNNLLCLELTTIKQKMVLQDRTSTTVIVTDTNTETFDAQAEALWFQALSDARAVRGGDVHSEADIGFHRLQQCMAILTTAYKTISTYMVECGLLGSAQQKEHFHERFVSGDFPIAESWDTALLMVYDLLSDLEQLCSSSHSSMICY